MTRTIGGSTVFQTKDPLETKIHFRRHTIVHTIMQRTKVGGGTVVQLLAVAVVVDLLLLVVDLFPFSQAFGIQRLTPPPRFSFHPHRAQLHNNDEAMDVWKSFQDFHATSTASCCWKGQLLHSFSISEDTAAGIRSRPLGINNHYQVQTTTKTTSDDIHTYFFREEYTYSTPNTTGSRSNSTTNNTILSHCTRPIHPSSSFMDIDSVDASYSLHHDHTNHPLPFIITSSTDSTPTTSTAPTTTTTLIEHVLVLSEHTRARLWVLYDPHNKQLLQIVIAHEERQSVHQQESSSTSSLNLYPISLLEACDGVWLGDIIVRQPLTNRPTSNGFAPKRKTTTNMPFSWLLGVQKSTWQWEWNFQTDSMQQKIHLGKSMGASAMIPHTLQSGRICVNESLSRRKAPQDRRVYVDWSSADAVGFLIGPYAVQVPRYLGSSSYWTEFAVFQKEETAVICSKSTRVYDNQQNYQQGCTSFYQLKRFIDDGE